VERIEREGPGPAEVVAREESRQQLWDAAARVLSEPQMTATWLYYAEDMSVGQIAQVLRCSKTAAKVTLFRARKKLLPVLEDLEARGSGEHRQGAGGSSQRPTNCGVDP
jgi:RNA polymerase sigma-70 factor (ECF subfamily)